MRHKLIILDGPFGITNYFFFHSTITMKKASILVCAMLGLNIWSVSGQPHCVGGMCQDQNDKRAENHILKRPYAFRKQHRSQQVQEIPILKQWIYPKHRTRHNLGKLRYPIRIRISRGALKNHLKYRTAKLHDSKKLTQRKKLKGFIHRKKERLRRNMDSAYRLVVFGFKRTFISGRILLRLTV